MPAKHQKGEEQETRGIPAKHQNGEEQEIRRARPVKKKLSQTQIEKLRAANVARRRTGLWVSPSADALIDVASEDAAGQESRAVVFTETERLREAIIDRAVEVIGDQQEALRWLGTPVRALDYATPISRLHDSQGQSDVLRVLTQLEHGVL